jgi:hypothetical protein
MHARRVHFAAATTLILAAGACSSGMPPATQPAPFNSPPAGCGSALSQCPCTATNAPDDTVFCGTCGIADVATPAYADVRCLYCPSNSVCKSVTTASSDSTFSAGTCPLLTPTEECVENVLPPTCPDSAPVVCENEYPAPSGCCQSGAYCCVGGCCGGGGGGSSGGGGPFNCSANSSQVQCTPTVTCASCSISSCGGPNGSACVFYETSDGQSFGSDCAANATCITNASNDAFAHCGCQ